MIGSFREPLVNQMIGVKAIEERLYSHNQQIIKQEGKHQEFDYWPENGIWILFLALGGHLTF